MPVIFRKKVKDSSQAELGRGTLQSRLDAVGRATRPGGVISAVRQPLLEKREKWRTRRTVRVGFSSAEVGCWESHFSKIARRGRPGRECIEGQVGSTVLTVKPHLGKWLEISASACCTKSVTSLSVFAAASPSTALNSTFIAGCPTRISAEMISA